MLAGLEEKPGNGKLGRHGSILQLLLANSVVDFGTTRPLFPGPVLSFPPSPPGSRPNPLDLFLYSDCRTRLTNNGQTGSHIEMASPHFSLQSINLLVVWLHTLTPRGEAKVGVVSSLSKNSVLFLGSKHS